MSGLVLLAVVCGTAATAGVVWLGWLFTGGRQVAGPPMWLVRTAAVVWRGGRRGLAAQRRYRAMTITAAGAGLVVWAVSGLPVLGVVAAVAVPGVPWLLGAAGAERRAIARVEAVADWTRRLRDVAGVGVGLQSAIVDTAATAPAAVAAPVGRLAARLQAGVDAQTALLRFADEVDDPVCDQVVQALLLHLYDHGDKLGAVLGAITSSASAEVAMRQEVDAERAASRFSIRFMVVFTVAVVAVGSLAGEYLAPYRTPAGQLVIVVLAAGMVAVLGWVRVLTRPRPGPRLLRGAEQGVG